MCVYVCTYVYVWMCVWVYVCMCVCLCMLMNYAPYLGMKSVLWLWSPTTLDEINLSYGRYEYCYKQCRGSHYVIPISPLQDIAKTSLDALRTHMQFCVHGVTAACGRLYELACIQACWKWNVSERHPRLSMLLWCWSYMLPMKSEVRDEFECVAASLTTLTSGRHTAQHP